MPKFFPFKRSTSNSERRGATAVEFALVVPIFALFCAVLLDFSRLSLARNAVQNAVYRGARHAMLTGVTREETIAEVNDYLSIFGLEATEGSVMVGQIYLDENDRALPVDLNSELDSESVEFHVEASVSLADATLLFPTFLESWVTGRGFHSEIRVRSERYSGFFNPAEAYAN